MSGIDDYIRRRLSAIEDGNQADHRSTSPLELETADKQLRKLYARGLEIIATIPEGDQKRCQRFYEAAIGGYHAKYQAYNLSEGDIKGVYVIAPLYLLQYDRMIRVMEALK